MSEHDRTSQSEALRKAAQALYDEVADHGLAWDECSNGCRFCDSLDALHRPGCSFVMLEKALEEYE